MVVVLLALSQSLAAGYMQNTDSKPVPRSGLNAEGTQPLTPIRVQWQDRTGVQYEEEKQKEGVGQDDSEK